MKLGRKKQSTKYLLLLVALFTIHLQTTKGQTHQSVKGIVTNQSNEDGVSFATISLHNFRDTSLVSGTISNEQGQFTLSSVPAGRYYLRISCIGYKTDLRELDLKNNSNYDTGKLQLQEAIINMQEAKVIANRIKAKTKEDRTVFFVNKKMVEASHSGVDILKHIPGIHVDLMQNISLEGSQNIKILVDGKERDLSFVQQLNAKQIDKVEVISQPGAKYDADISGVLNVLLKEKKSGFNGHINAEIPTSDSEMYLHPSYSFHYGRKKWNAYTSYNGDFAYFDVYNTSYKSILESDGTKEISSLQTLRQKSWSHHFHYGMDLFLNPKNQLNFYAYYNPCSFEQDGNIKLQVKLDEQEQEYGLFDKEDTDRTYYTFYSLYYKHLFNQAGSEITCDLSYFNFKADNATSYRVLKSSIEDLNHQISIVEPNQNAFSFRIDYTTTIAESLHFSSGIKAQLRELTDKQSPRFEYDENRFSTYGSFRYHIGKWDLGVGLRSEYSKSHLRESFQNSNWALLPNAAFNYKLNTRQNLKLQYRQSIKRPNRYQLNTTPILDDLYSVSIGNAEMDAEFHHNLSLEYALRFGNHFLSSRLFYTKTSNAIRKLTVASDGHLLESRMYNLGDIHQYGLQLSGALQIGKFVNCNPYVKLFQLHSAGNQLSKHQNVENIHKMAMESNISVIAKFRKDLFASAQFKYSTPNVQFQKKSYTDAIYLFSLDKGFGQKLKIGLVWALPFSQSITYQGTEIKGTNFCHRSEGNVKLSGALVWFKINYQFSSGAKSKKIKRTLESLKQNQKKGF